MSVLRSIEQKIEGLFEGMFGRAFRTHVQPVELARKLAWAEAFPERMRRMGECAKADYKARFLPHWSHPRLFGERRRLPRHAG